jgi:hypothetical protein
MEGVVGVFMWNSFSSAGTLEKAPGAVMHHVTKCTQEGMNGQKHGFGVSEPF